MLARLSWLEGVRADVGMLRARHSWGVVGGTG